MSQNHSIDRCSLGNNSRIHRRRRCGGPIRYTTVMTRPKIAGSRSNGRRKERQMCEEGSGEERGRSDSKRPDASLFSTFQHNILQESLFTLRQHMFLQTWWWKMTEKGRVLHIWFRGGGGKDFIRTYALWRQRSHGWKKKLLRELNVLDNFLFQRKLGKMWKE